MDNEYSIRRNTLRPTYFLYIVGRNELRRMRSLGIDDITIDQNFKNVIQTKF